MAKINPSADVAESAQIGEGSSVWHLAQVREDAVLGKNCVVGRGAYVGTGVVMGDNCKLQNYALVYEPARLENGVFVGPAAVFTNDHYPRATFHRNGTQETEWVDLAQFRGVSEGDSIRYAFGKREPLLVEHENFRDAVLGKGGTVVTFAQGVHTIEVASAVLESSKGHGEIEIGAQPQAVIS